MNPGDVLGGQRVQLSPETLLADPTLSHAVVLWRSSESATAMPPSGPTSAAGAPRPSPCVARIRAGPTRRPPLAQDLLAVAEVRPMSPGHAGAALGLGGHSTHRTDLLVRS